MIELLIASVVSLVVIGGMIGMLMSVIQSNRTKTAITNSTETLRHAHFVISQQVRNAETLAFDGTYLIIGAPSGGQDCLGGNRRESRFSFAGGSLTCATGDPGSPGSPETIAAGLQGVQFEFGCLLAAGANSVTEFRNANFAAAATACDAANRFAPGRKVSTVFITLTINPFASEGGVARSVDFAATARGIMMQRITGATI